MRWNAFVRRLAFVVCVYGIVVILIRIISATPWQLISYFMVLKELSLVALLWQGVEAVRLAEKFQIPVPRWLRILNAVILLVAMFALFLAVIKYAIKYNPSTATGEHWAHIIGAAMQFTSVIPLLPLFFYTMLNLFILTLPTEKVERSGWRLPCVDRKLKEKIREYFLFADLTCAIPALGLLLLLLLTGGLTGPDAEMALAVGAGTLIFVSNTASFAVNELVPGMQLSDKRVSAEPKAPLKPVAGQ